MKSGDYTYIWQASDWPTWRFDLAALAQPLGDVSRAQGLLMGRLADVGMALRDQALLSALTEDVIKTSEIEGEQLNLESVRSFIARRLGVVIGALVPVDRHVEDMVEMVPQSGHTTFTIDASLIEHGPQPRVCPARPGDNPEPPIRVGLLQIARPVRSPYGSASRVKAGQGCSQMRHSLNSPSQSAPLALGSARRIPRDADLTAERAAVETSYR